MKKKILFLVILCMTVVTSSAQFFIEGNLGGSYAEVKGKNEGILSSQGSSYSISIAPKVGYWLNDRMAIGLAASYGRSTSKSENVQQGNSQYGFSTFGRYQLYRKEKFSLQAEGSLGYNKYRAQSNPSSGSSASSNVVGINVYPLIVYDLTDRFGMIATSDLMSLGFNYQALKYTSSESTSKSSDYRFGLSTDAMIFNSLRVGFIYKF
jgi:hypothetical protein